MTGFHALCDCGKLLTTFMLAMAAPAMGQEIVLTIDGERFQLNGRPFDMWGIRVASATMDDSITQHLIDQLDDYKSHGVNTVTVFYSGSSAGYYDPFSADGKALNADHQERMERIIQEAADRGMVVVVGIFYQRVNYGLRNDMAAVTEAVRTVAHALQPYRNVMINIANEQNSSRYDRIGMGMLRDPQTIIDLAQVVKETDPDRLVGGGGYDHVKNEIIGRSPSIDALLFDTSGPEDSGGLYRRFRDAGVVDKPIVNVETFGGWTGKFKPPGVFPGHVREVYLNEVDAAAAEAGLSVFFHNNPWLQGPSEGSTLRYDLAGQGMTEDPGIRWYFEYVHMVREPSSAAPLRLRGPHHHVR